MTKPFCPTCKEEFNTPIRYCPNDGTAVISPAVENRQDQVFDQRYRLAEKIGEGGMGSVYKAIQLSTGKFVAIKVVSAKHTQNEETIKRFQREVKLQTKLSHPNLVSVLDFSKTAEGEYYFVMEFVEGKSLTKFIKEKGQLSLDDFMEISAQLCDGLEYAHRQGIIHRDLKGDNIIVTDIGHQLVVKILDFGLAKAVMDGDQQITSEITQMGSALGTPAYMAPEQAMGEVNKLGPHTDIYTLGVLFYQMLAGQLPFKAATPWGLMQKHIAEAPLPLREFNRSVPNAVQKVIMTCIEKDPDDRYSSAVAIKRDLEKTTFALQKSDTVNLADSDETTVSIKAIRSRFYIKLALGLVMAISIGGLAFLYSTNPELYGDSGLEFLRKIKGYFSLSLEEDAPPPDKTPAPQPPEPPAALPGPDGGSATPGLPSDAPPSATPGVTDPNTAAPPPPSPETAVAPPVNEKIMEEFAALITEANKDIADNLLDKAKEHIIAAEKLIPNDPSLEMAKKALEDKLLQVAKAISDDIGYIDAVDKKWGFITISRIKGVKADLEEKLYVVGEKGAALEITVKKIKPTKLSAVTKAKLSLFHEGMKVTRNPPPDKKGE